MSGTKDWKKKISAVGLSLLLLGLVSLAMLSGCASSSVENTEPEPAQSAPEQVQEENTTQAPAAEEVEEEAEESETQSFANGKTLLVYFSETGNTEGIAEKMADILGVDTFKIEAADPYTSEDLDYNDEETRATKEQNEGTARPEIANQVENWDDYDTIIIGHPIWWGKVPRILMTFAESYDWDGKSVAEFCTSGSSGIEGARSELESAAEGAEWIDAQRFASDASEKTIAGWLEDCGFTVED